MENVGAVMVEDDDTPKAAQDDEEEPSLKEERRWKLFSDTRKAYIASKNDQSNLKDKYVLALSSASLALSITYIEKILPAGEVKYPALLLFSWALFAFSLVSTIVVYNTGVRCHDDYIKQIDEKYEADEDFRNISSKRDEVIDLLNQFSLWGFVAGLITFGAFAAINFISRLPG